MARCGLRSGKEPGRQQGSAGSGARSDPDGPRRGGTPGGARKWEIIFTVPFAPEGAHDQNGEDCQGLPETHPVCVREQIRLLSSDPPQMISEVQGPDICRNKPDWSKHIWLCRVPTGESGPERPGSDDKSLCEQV